MSEDHCSICMDPLEWTGFGPCGHKEVRAAGGSAWQAARRCAARRDAGARQRACSTSRSWPPAPARRPLTQHNPAPATHNPKQACSRCVARLRFVLEDKRCMYCHQDLDAVFFTRYMGDFTARPAGFDQLKVRMHTAWCLVYGVFSRGKSCSVHNSRLLTHAAVEPDLFALAAAIAALCQRSPPHAVFAPCAGAVGHGR